MVLHALCALLRRRLDALVAAPEKMGRVRAGAHRVFFRASDSGFLSLSHDCPLNSPCLSRSISPTTPAPAPLAINFRRYASECVAHLLQSAPAYADDWILQTDDHAERVIDALESGTVGTVCVVTSKPLNPSRWLTGIGSLVAVIVLLFVDIVTAIGALRDLPPFGDGHGLVAAGALERCRSPGL
jgi:hypothetical protein